MGATGKAVGIPHLHFGGYPFVRHAHLGKPVDPLDFIVGCFDPTDSPPAALQRDGSLRLTLTYPVRCRHRTKRAN